MPAGMEVGTVATDGSSVPSVAVGDSVGPGDVTSGCSVGSESSVGSGCCSGGSRCSGGSGVSVGPVVTVGSGVSVGSEVGFSGWSVGDGLRVNWGRSGGPGGVGRSRQCAGTPQANQPLIPGV